MTDTLIQMLEEIRNRAASIRRSPIQENSIVFQSGEILDIAQQALEIVSQDDALRQNVLNGINMALHHLQADGALNRNLLCDSLNSAKNILLLREPNRKIFKPKICTCTVDFSPCYQCQLKTARNSIEDGQS